MAVHQRRWLMMLVLAGTIVVSAIAASSASAVLKRLPNGQVVSYMPLLKAQPGQPHSTTRSRTWTTTVVP